MLTHRFIPLIFTLLLTFGIYLIFDSEEELYDPFAIFLTWQQDPATTMTIDWHVIPEDGDRTTILQYQMFGENDWLEAESEILGYPYETDSLIYRVELTGLEANSNYRFRFGEDSKAYSFRTMPESLDDRPVVFAAGGDVRLGECEVELRETGNTALQNMERTNLVVMEYDLDFIVWGGDLAYGDGRNFEEDYQCRWDEFFTGIKNTLIDEGGRVIPILVSTGNHEVLGGYYYNDDHDKRKEYEVPPYADDDAIREMIAPFFFRFLAFPGQPGYNVLDFGDYLSIVSIDTDHANPLEGKQVQWLEQVLSERVDVPHVFPLYHVPAYPTHRSDDDRTVSNVQKYLPPLFEEYGIRVVLENHDHTYKRTWPIRNNQIAEDGIVYIGDGAWGVREPRTGRRSDEWYINQFADVRHGIIVTLDDNTQDYVMINELGEIIDTFNSDYPVELPPPSPPSYEPVIIYPRASPPRVELQPEFAWEPVTNATEYQLQLAIGNFATGMVLDTTILETKIVYPGKLEENESYRWQVQALNEGGPGPWSDNIMFTTVRSEVTNIDQDVAIPTEYSLEYNYPNPFNPNTTIRYGIPVSANVELRVYDIIGREVATLVNEEQPAGFHSITYNMESLNSGIYIYRIRVVPAGGSADIFTQSRNMTLIK